VIYFLAWALSFLILCRDIDVVADSKIDSSSLGIDVLLLFCLCFGHKLLALLDSSVHPGG
jgi:hypothetical protein